MIKLDAIFILDSQTFKDSPKNRMSCRRYVNDVGLVDVFFPLCFLFVPFALLTLQCHCLMGICSKAFSTLFPFFLNAP